GNVGNAALLVADLRNLYQRSISAVGKSAREANNILQGFSRQRFKNRVSFYFSLHFHMHAIGRHADNILVLQANVAFLFALGQKVINIQRTEDTAVADDLYFSEGAIIIR